METGSEAEEFECGVCCKQLDRPKLLPCLHSICQACLRNEWAGHGDATCPVCSAPTDGEVTNLQDNTFIANLVAKLQLRRRIGLGSDISCGPCLACGDDRPATSLCFECDKFLCLRCCHSHQLFMENYSHLVETLDNLRKLGCEDFVTLARNKKQIVCPDHREQRIRFFCKTCSTSICCNCLLLHHISPDHCYHDIKEEVALKKGELKQMTDATQENHNKFTETYTDLKSLMGSLDLVKNDTEVLIKQKASAMIQEINKQGEGLLRELETEHDSEHSRLLERLNRTEQIIKRMGAGKELAGKLLKFGNNEEMMEMYKTVESALAALAGETSVVVSKEAILLEFMECTLEAQILLGSFIPKKEQSEEAGTSEVDEVLMAKLLNHHQERTPSGEGPANLEALPAGEEMVLPPLLRATMDCIDEVEFGGVVLPFSSSQGSGPGPSGRAPFTREGGQVERPGEEEEGSEQPVSPGPDSSAWKSPEKLRGKRSWSVEDKNAADVKKQHWQSEHNYSMKGPPRIISDCKPELLSWSSTDETMLNISIDLGDEDTYQLPAEETITILSEDSEDIGISSMTEVQNKASSAVMTNESTVSSHGHLGHNMVNWTSGDGCRDKAGGSMLCQEMDGDPMVFFQLQTTGMEGSGDIVQLSAVSGEKIFDKYILPRNPISAGAAAINGLQVMDGILYLRGEPQPTCSLQDAMAAFLQFLQSMGRPLLAGHNIWIRDCQIVYKAWGDLFMKDQFARCVTGFLDTLWLARDIVPRSEVKNYRLKHLVVARVGKLFLADGALDNVRALQELYSVLKPTQMQKQSSHFSLSQLECRVSLQPLFDQEVITRIVADELAFKEISLNILQLAHHSDPQTGVRDLVSASSNLGLRNPQQAIHKIQWFLQLQKWKCRRRRSECLKLENK
ncbi:protein PML-like [Heptranchias perlo]|uniref:protein PML-like n=1 Tax=Heptranchias perlo TaxID=212740 RepID=UPI003559D7C6